MEAKTEKLWIQDLGSQLNFEISFWMRKLRGQGATEAEIKRIVRGATNLCLNHEGEGRENT